MASSLARLPNLVAHASSAARRYLATLRRDRATLYATLGNAASLLLGPVTVYLVSARLSPVLQGFYYTFGSLSLLQLLAEFGLGQVLIQTVSHQWHKLRMAPSGALIGDEDALNRVRQLAALALRWCASLSLVLVAGLVTAGFVLFRHAPPGVEWRGPWLLLVASMVANFMLAPVWAIVQGCNETVSFWMYRAVQQVVNACALWVLLIARVDLWAQGIAGIAGLVWSFGFLLHRYPQFVWSLRGAQGRTGSLWRRHVWPLQWRTGIAWLGANYLGVALIPLLFHRADAAAAGRFGMTATLCNVLLAASTNVVVTKAPQLCSLAAQGRYHELDREFGAAFRRMLATLLAGAALVLVGLACSLYAGLPIATRLLDPASFALYLGYASASAVVIAINTYLRAFGGEPFAKLYAGSGVAILVVAAIVAPRAGTLGVTAAAFLAAALLQLPAAYVFLRAKRVDMKATSALVASDPVTSLSGSPLATDDVSP